MLCELGLDHLRRRESAIQRSQAYNNTLPISHRDTDFIQKIRPARPISATMVSGHIVPITIEVSDLLAIRFARDGTCPPYLLSY
jgi:hypothetical protein